MKKTIFMVSGLKRCGKDFTSSMLVKTLEHKKIEVVRMSFAEPMKKILTGTLGILPSEFEEYKNVPSDFKLTTSRSGVHLKQTDYRSIIQRFGSEAMKSVFGNDVWTDLMIKRIALSDVQAVVISDWRFKDEYFGIHSKFQNDIMSDTDIVTIRVEREGQVNDSDHISENDLNDLDFDYIINNDGKTSKTIQRRINKIIKESL
jgi:hypothetical protein